MYLTLTYNSVPSSMEDLADLGVWAHSNAHDQRTEITLQLPDDDLITGFGPQAHEEYRTINLIMGGRPVALELRTDAEHVRRLGGEPALEKTRQWMADHGSR